MDSSSVSPASSVVESLSRLRDRNDARAEREADVLDEDVRLVRDDACLIGDGDDRDVRIDQSLAQRLRIGRRADDYVGADRGRQRQRLVDRLDRHHREAELQQNRFGHIAAGGIALDHDHERTITAGIARAASAARIFASIGPKSAFHAHDCMPQLRIARQLPSAVRVTTADNF